MMNAEFFYSINYDELDDINKESNNLPPPSASPTDLGIFLDFSIMNITTIFSGGITADGVMFDFCAKEPVVVYSMDIITSFLGNQGI